MESMRELYRHLLAEAYDAERHTLMLLDQLETHLGAPDARERARSCRAATGRQLEMLERAMELLGGACPPVTSAALQGVRDDHRRLVAAAAAPSVLETGGVVALGRACELTAALYRSLAALAVVCGQADARRLLERALAEEEDASAWCTAALPRLAAEATLQRGPAAVA